MNAPRRGQLRIRYQKQGKIRFTSHRDVARIWERTLRKAHIPVAYSEGFSPRPRLSFGLALSTGSTSRAEYIDVVLDAARSQPCGLEDLPALLSGALPAGLDVTGVAEVAPGAASLQQAVTSCCWELTVMNTTTEAAGEWVQEILAADTIVVTRERKGKPVIDDLRPAIRSLELLGTTDLGDVLLDAELSTQPRALRPSELLAALEPPFQELGTTRTSQWIESEGARHDPLEVHTTNVVTVPADAAPVPRSLERVS